MLVKVEKNDVIHDRPEGVRLIIRKSEEKKAEEKQAILESGNLTVSIGREDALMGLPVETDKALFKSDRKAEPQNLIRRVIEDLPEMLFDGVIVKNRGWVLENNNNNIHPTAFLGPDVVILGENVIIEEEVVLCGEIIVYDNTTIRKGVVMTAGDIGTDGIIYLKTPGRKVTRLGDSEYARY